MYEKEIWNEYGAEAGSHAEENTKAKGVGAKRGALSGGCINVEVKTRRLPGTDAPRCNIVLNMMERRTPA